jgi:hypothetical protein
MTITILTPEGSFIGPDMQITAFSSATGPLVPGSTLLIDFYQSGGETLCLRYQFTPSLGYNFVTLDTDHLNPGPYTAILAPNAATTILTSIVSASGTFDSGTTTGLTWNTEGQIPLSMKKLDDLVSTGGFTTEDRTQLAAIDTNVTSVLAGILTDIPGFAGNVINNIIGQPAPGLITRSEIGDFTECGALTRPAFGVEVDAFGLAWEVISIGGGVGIDPSVPQRFEPWLLQLEQRHSDHDGHEYTSAAVRFDYSNGYWFFQPILPHLINYCILPSATLRFYWLLITV